MITKIDDKIIWPAHGKSNVFVRGRVLFLEFHGAFNLEGTEKTVQTSLNLIQKELNDGTPWAQIIDLRQFELSTPDTQDIISYYYTNAYSLGLRCEAVLTKTPIIEEFNKKLMFQFQSIVTPHYFLRKADAVVFLSEQGYSTYQPLD
jgi:hypothetical protein